MKRNKITWKRGVLSESSWFILFDGVIRKVFGTGSAFQRKIKSKWFTFR